MQYQDSTAGTGSEGSAGAIVSDEESNAKVGVRSNYLRPCTALMHSLLALSYPKAIPAATGFDVLVHTVEGGILVQGLISPRLWARCWPG